MTDILLYNRDFKIQSILDSYESLIWSMRANEPGDFELYLPKTNDNVSLFKNPFADDTNMYVAIPGVFRYDEYFPMMIVETVEFSDGDNVIKLSGRSLESILDRRIIWGQQSYNSGDYVLNVIQDIVNRNIINPQNPSRTINGFTFQAAVQNTKTLDDAVQYEGTSILDILSELCETYGFVYNITISDESLLDIRLDIKEPLDYTGSLPGYVNKVFSTELNNFYNVKYVESTNTLKTSAFVSGMRYSDDEAGKFYQTEDVNYSGMQTSGVYRRELYVNASDIQYDDDAGNIYGTTTYSSFLRDRGKLELKNNKKTIALEGDINIYDDIWYQLIGSTVIINGGNENLRRKAKIKELIYSVSNSEETLVPTFEIVDDSLGFVE